MPTTITEVLPIEVTVSRSTIDGRILIEIDVEERADVGIRVFLNDAPLYDGNPSENENAYALLEKMHVTDVSTDWDENGNADVRNEIELAWRQIAEARG